MMDPIAAIVLWTALVLLAYAGIFWVFLKIADRWL